MRRDTSYLLGPNVKISETELIDMKANDLKSKPDLKLLESESELKKQRKEISMRFVFFLEFWDLMDKNNPVMLNDLYESFLNQNQIDSKVYSVKRFKAAIIFTSGKLDIPVFFRKVRVKGGKQEINFKKNV